MQNIDELFEREEFSAAPDVGWPDCFNSGVFVFKPNNDTYSSLLNFALQKGSFDGFCTLAYFCTLITWKPYVSALFICYQNINTTQNIVIVE